MSSLSAKDRVSLCSFTFSDGRRCRAPRVGNNPCFCPYHAEKEARARAAQKLGEDLDYFFSGDYLSACDLSTALARLIPAVVRGDVKPKTAHTVAYLAQTLMQSIHLSKHEYINAFGTDGWREAVRNSVNGNQDYRFPPAPKPEQPESPQPQPQPTPPQPAPSPHTSLPPTSAEFVQHVVAGLQTGGGQALQPAQATQPAPAQTRSPIPTQASPTQTSAPPPSTSRAPQTPAAHTAPPSPACHPERSEGSHPIPATDFAGPAAPAAQPNNPPPTASPTPKPVLPLDSRALQYDHNYRLRIDGKLV